MAELSSKESILPCFTAQFSLVDSYASSLFSKYKPGLPDLILAAYVDPSCFENCSNECPPAGPQRVFCVKECRQECTCPGGWHCSNGRCCNGTCSDGSPCCRDIGGGFEQCQFV